MDGDNPYVVGEEEETRTLHTTKSLPCSLTPDQPDQWTLRGDIQRNRGHGIRSIPCLKTARLELLAAGLVMGDR